MTRKINLNWGMEESPNSLRTKNGWAVKDEIIASPRAYDNSYYSRGSATYATAGTHAAGSCTIAAGSNGYILNTTAAGSGYSLTAATVAATDGSWTNANFKINAPEVECEIEECIEEDHNANWTWGDDRDKLAAIKSSIDHILKEDNR